MLLGNGGYILGGGGWWWVYFEWWWVVVGIFLGVDGDRGCWMMVVGGG